jgi:hypothetical protein
MGEKREELEDDAGGLVNDRSVMLSKQEFRVKYETEVMDLGIPRDGSMLEVERCRGDWAAVSDQIDLRFVDVDPQFPLGEIPE